VTVSADVEEQLGIANSGTVHSLFDYTACNSDELSFHAGEEILIVRKRDDVEKDWWWARLRESEGYIPRNYIGVRNHAYIVR